MSESAHRLSKLHLDTASIGRADPEGEHERRVAIAEESLGVRLFERRSGGYFPTQAARDVAEHASQMELSEAALRRRLEDSVESLTGTFTITAPQLLFATHLATVIGAFLQAMPNVDLHLRATEEKLSLDRREADLALRISRDPGETLVGRRLVPQDTAAFATPDLVRRMQDDPAAPVEWLGFDFWKTTPRATLPAYKNQTIKMRFDDMAAATGAAKAGLGVIRMPLFLGYAAPELVRAPILPPQPYIDIWMLTHRDLKDTPKVRAFKDIAVPYFRSVHHVFCETRPR